MRLRRYDETRRSDGNILRKKLKEGEFDQQEDIKQTEKQRTAHTPEGDRSEGVRKLL